MTGGQKANEQAVCPCVPGISDNGGGIAW